MPIVAKHAELQLVIFQQDNELIVCHAGCFNNPLENSAPGWWLCSHCKHTVKERRTIDKEYGEWPGAHILIPAPGSATAVIFKE